MAGDGDLVSDLRNLATQIIERLDRETARIEEEEVTEPSRQDNDKRRKP